MEQHFEVIIPSKKWNHLCQRAYDRIRTLYSSIKICFVLDEARSEPVKNDDNLRLINAKTKSIGAKRNQAAVSSNAEYLIFLDSDAYPLSRWIDEPFNIFQNNDSTAVVGGPWKMDPNSNFQQQCSYLAEKSFLLGGSGARVYSESPKKLPYISSCNMFVKKSIYLKIGGMNENLTTGEDIDFCLRTTRHNYRILFSNDCNVVHKTRSFIGFLKQRFVWGIGVSSLLKLVGLQYWKSIIPLICLLALIGGFLVPQLILITTILLSVFTLISVIEAFRYRLSLAHVPLTFLFIFLSIPTIGLGHLCNIVIADNFNILKWYNNEE